MRFLGWGCSAIPKRAWSPCLLDGVFPKKPPAQSSLPGSAVSQKPPFKVLIIAKSASGKPPPQALGRGRLSRSPILRREHSSGDPHPLLNSLPGSKAPKGLPLPFNSPLALKRSPGNPPGGSPGKPLPGSPLVPRGLRGPTPASAPSSPPCSSQLPKPQ